MPNHDLFQPFSDLTSSNGSSEVQTAENYLDGKEILSMLKMYLLRILKPV